VTFLPECYNSNRQGVVSKNFPFVSLKGKSFLFSEEVWRGPQEDRRSAFQQTRGFTYRTKEWKSDTLFRGQRTEVSKYGTPRGLFNIAWRQNCIEDEA
jgi:hypothetical protein